MQGRLLRPVVDGREVAWPQALGEAGERLRNIINEWGPQAVAFYASGQLLTEDYDAANKLMKGFIGAANIDTNSRLCMSSAVVGYKRAFGEDVVPCSYEDVENSDSGGTRWLKRGLDASGAVSAAGAGKAQQSADESGRDQSA